MGIPVVLDPVTGLPKELASDKSVYIKSGKIDTNESVIDLKTIINKDASIIGNLADVDWATIDVDLVWGIKVALIPVLLIY